MSPHWLRIVVGICLAGLAAGCKVPPVPDHVRNGPDYRSGASEAAQTDGWLWRRLTGQETQAQAAESAATRMGAASGVRQASATEPVRPGQGPAPGETVVTPAVVAAATASKPQEEEEKSFIDSLSPTNLYKQAKALAGYGPNEQIAKQAFQEGQQLFDGKQYDEAAKKFSTAADRWPDSPLEEDALFMLAECLFFSDQYSKAEDAYEKLLKKYQYSRYVDKAVARQFAIGRYWEQHHLAEPHWPITPNFTDKTRPLFDTGGYALKCYEHVRLNDPTGPLADDSPMASGTAHYNDGRFEEAAFEYDLLRKEYPKSEHAMNASLLCLDAKQRIYQGPLYDGTPLRDAGEVADQTLTRFGPALGEKRSLILDTKNQIVEQKAEREWSMAQYYDKNQYFGAARYYYNSIIEEYPQTKYSEAARQRLAQIKDLPAEPPDRFGWLNKIVNPKKRRGPANAGPSAPSGPAVAGSGGG